MKNIYNWLKTKFQKPQVYLEYRRFSIFKELNDFELYLLHNVMNERSFKAGEVLFEAGFPMEVVYCICKGQIQLTLASAGERLLQIGKNEMLGLWDMFHNDKRNSSARATSDVTAFAITECDLWDLIESRPRMGTKILSAICTEIVKDALGLPDTEV